MNHDKFNDSLNALLSEGRVSHVISILKSKCEASAAAHPDLHRVLVSVSAAEETYSHLRRFLINGIADPGRNELYNSIKENLRSLGRQFLFIINEDRIDPFFNEYRLMKVRNLSVSSIAEELKKVDFRIEMARETEADPLNFILKREELLDTLFRLVWSLPPWAEDDFKALSTLLSEVSFEVKAQLISALLLGIMKFNDPSKLLLLLHLYQNDEDERVAARALMAIVLVLGRWGDSAVSTPAIEDALKDLELSLLTYSRLKDIVMTLIRTRDTDRVSRELDETIKSTMMNISPEMLEKLQKEGLDMESPDGAMNPEWEKLMKNTDFEDKMKAINDMQMEGMDIMMQTFSRLKSFPFFRLISNWFAPFSPDNTHVSPLFKNFDYKGFAAMTEATEMCASDRYSFALGILQMPLERRSMLEAHFSNQLEVLKEMTKDRDNVRRRSVFATEALLFARDLYRFSKLFPKKNMFYDPFVEPVDFLRLPLLRSMLAGDAIIVESADFYFHHGYYPLALSLYEESVAYGEVERHVFEKIGFCRQMTGDFKGALESYEKAELFDSESDRSSSWLLKKLAFCNKALGRYSKAAEYYGLLHEMHPDDLSIEFQLGSALIRSGEIKKGKEIISKVCYIAPDHMLASRILSRLKGHDAFLEGRYSDALKLYEEAKGDRPRADYRRDLYAELMMIDPSADKTLLNILLD